VVNVVSGRWIDEGRTALESIKKLPTLEERDGLELVK